MEIIDYYLLNESFQQLLKKSHKVTAKEVNSEDSKSLDLK